MARAAARKEATILGAVVVVATVVTTIGTTHLRAGRARARASMRTTTMTSSRTARVLPRARGRARVKVAMTIGGDLAAMRGTPNARKAAIASELWRPLSRSSTVYKANKTVLRDAVCTTRP